MDFYAVLDQVVVLYTHPQVVDDAGRGLRWTGDTAVPQTLAPPGS